MTTPATPSLPSSLVLVGAGRMGGAMLEGWLKVGLDPARTAILDPKPSDEVLRLCGERGIALNPAPATITAPEVLVLAVKPQMLDAAAGMIDGLVGPGTLLLSILAGKTVGDLCARLPRASAVVRAMPNLPASIGCGATGAFASPGTSGAQKAIVAALLRSVGIVEWLDREDLIDAVTAVSGSGPAYVFLLCECLAAAGASVGLPPALAQRLARATVTGSGELLAQSAANPETLRQNVTSPGGTTAAALEILMAEGGLATLMGEAVAAARRRAEELSG